MPDATLPRFERRSRKALLVDRKKLWTPPESQAFLAHSDDRWYPVWYVLASTGMRRSEICGLRSESVDLERAVITVDWKVVSVHNELYEGDPKSESSIREITIDDHTVQVLRAWREVKRRDRPAAREAWWTVRSNPSSRWLAGSMRLRAGLLPAQWTMRLAAASHSGGDDH